MDRNSWQVLTKNDFWKDILKRWEEMKAKPNVLADYINWPMIPYRSKSSIESFFKPVSPPVTAPLQKTTSSPILSNSPSSSTYAYAPTSRLMYYGFNSIRDEGKFIKNVNNASINKEFFADISFLEVDNFFTDDIVNDQSLMLLPSTLSIDWKGCNLRRKEYEKNRLRKRESLVSKHIQNCGSTFSSVSTLNRHKRRLDAQYVIRRECTLRGN